MNDDRKVLYNRIEKRIDQMLEEGLVEEVRALKELGCTRELVSMQGLGYKEILAYLEGEITLSEAVYLLKRDTRHFAKRQLTWFRRERDVIWIEKQEFHNDETLILNEILRILKGKKICASLQIEYKNNIRKRNEEKNMTEITTMYQALGISEPVLRFGREVEAKLKERFEEIDRITEYNQLKVIKGMQDCMVSAECF